MLLSQSLQSKRRIENDRMIAEIAIVEGANSMEVGSVKKREKKHCQEMRMGGWKISHGVDTMVKTHETKISRLQEKRTTILDVSYLPRN